MLGRFSARQSSMRIAKKSGVVRLYLTNWCGKNVEQKVICLTRVKNTNFKNLFNLCCLLAIALAVRFVTVHCAKMSVDMYLV